MSSFTHTGYEVVFAVSGDMKKYTQDLLELDVHNRFTDVHTAVIDRVEDYSPGENRCLIVLTSSAEQAESKIPGSKNGLPVFVIEVGSGDGQVRTVKKGMWVLACRPDGIFDAVFHCLLQGPLRIAFRRCMQSLLQKHTDVELAKIGAVDPVLLVQVADRIEAGTSASIGVSADPPVAVLPELEFAVLNQKVAYCNGLTVYGKGKPEQRIRSMPEGKQNTVLPSDDHGIYAKSDQRPSCCPRIPCSLALESLFAFQQTTLRRMRIMFRISAGAAAIVRSREWIREGG